MKEQLEKEFESNHIIGEFKRLYEESFGKVKDQVDPRQKADLIAFFLAGAQEGMNISLSLIKQNPYAAEVLIEEFRSDNYDRAKFCVECMVKNDYSHSMFK
jgi:hypothetical protein